MTTLPNDNEKHSSDAEYLLSFTKQEIREDIKLYEPHIETI